MQRVDSGRCPSAMNNGKTTTGARLPAPRLAATYRVTVAADSGRGAGRGAGEGEARAYEGRIGEKQLICVAGPPPRHRHGHNGRAGRRVEETRESRRLMMIVDRERERGRSGGGGRREQHAEGGRKEMCNCRGQEGWRGGATTQGTDTHRRKTPKSTTKERMVKPPTTRWEHVDVEMKPHETDLISASNRSQTEQTKSQQGPATNRIRHRTIYMRGGSKGNIRRDWGHPATHTTTAFHSTHTSKRQRLETREKSGVGWQLGGAGAVCEWMMQRAGGGRWWRGQRQINVHNNDKRQAFTGDFICRGGWRLAVGDQRCGVERRTRFIVSGQ